MIITEESWNKIITGIDIEKHSYLHGLILETLNKLLSKNIFIIRFYIETDDLGSLGSLEEKDYYNFVWEYIKRKYELRPGLKKILVYNKKSSNSDELCLNPNFLSKENKIGTGYTALFGDDIFIHMKISSHGCTLPYTLYYTSTSIETALEIANELRTKYLSLLKEPDEKTFSVKFITLHGTEVEEYGRKITLKTDLSRKILFPEDLPEENIIKFLGSDESGIIIFHGIPGSGKSSYIKHLILRSNKDLPFYVVSAGSGDQLVGLKNYIINSKTPKIFIMEDCEKILCPREKSNYNPFLTDLLNLSDGILGDLSGAKFILTFNSSEKVDPAILRKGRTKFMFEFGPVKGPRLLELAKENKIKLTPEDEKRGLTLAEIFNYDEKEYVKKRNKLGF